MAESLASFAVYGEDIDWIEVPRVTGTMVQDPAIVDNDLERETAL